MNKHTKARRLKWPLLVAVLASGVGVGWYFNRSSDGPPNPDYGIETEALSRGELTQVVTASGQLNPVLKVEIGSQISGIIQNLSADFNSNVKAGELIAQIDPGTYEANFIQAEGNLANARAALELAQVNTRRNQELFKNNLISQAEYDGVMANLHQAEASAKISEGALKKAQVDLARCKIYAPVDGIVISRDVNVGQTVAASLSAPKLFVIANDLAKMQIEAKIAEADIGRIAVGQEVKFTVDAFPGEAFRGQVTQVRNAPAIDQNVVTYDTIIEVKNPELKLKPGMTANVTITIAHRENVLKIPNAAFRFRPPKGVEVKKIEAKEAEDKKTKVADAAATSQSKPEGEKPSEDAKPKKDKKDKQDKRKAGGTVYVLRDSALHSVKVKTGITDGRETELIEGLNEDDAVIVDISGARENPTLMSRLLAVIKKKRD
jgi:HlyD family secretion protein